MSNYNVGDIISVPSSVFFNTPIVEQQRLQKRFFVLLKAHDNDPRAEDSKSSEWIYGYTSYMWHIYNPTSGVQVPSWSCMLRSQAWLEQHATLESPAVKQK